MFDSLFSLLAATGKEEKIDKNQLEILYRDDRSVYVCDCVCLCVSMCVCVCDLLCVSASKSVVIGSDVSSQKIQFHKYHNFLAMIINKPLLSACLPVGLSVCNPVMLPDMTSLP